MMNIRDMPFNVLLAHTLWQGLGVLLFVKVGICSAHFQEEEKLKEKESGFSQLNSKEDSSWKWQERERERGRVQLLLFFQVKICLFISVTELCRIGRLHTIKFMTSVWKHTRGLTYKPVWGLFKHFHYLWLFKPGFTNPLCLRTQKCIIYLHT